MIVNEQKDVADLPATTLGTGSANISTGVRPQNTFTRCGSISREKMALRVDYESFGQKHVAYISAAGIMSLTGPGNIPCDVEEMTEGIDGTIVIEKVGRAWWSRSGRALVIRTTQSDGEIMAPWSQFRKVIDRQVQKAAISWFNPPGKPSPCPSIESRNSISTGLDRGF